VGADSHVVDDDRAVGADHHHADDDHHDHDRADHGDHAVDHHHVQSADQIEAESVDTWDCFLRYLDWLGVVRIVITSRNQRPYADLCTTDANVTSTRSDRDSTGNVCDYDDRGNR
jgi:hypothetical protein